MGLTFCNNYRTTIYTAISFWSDEDCGGEGGNWQNMGWYVLAPGSCGLVYANDLEDLNRYWYYYAEADDGAVWAGEYPTRVTDAAFNLCDGIGSTDQRIVGFRELDIGDNDGYTLSFTP